MTTLTEEAKTRDRFMQYVFPEPMSGCWLWTGAVQERRYGHGRFGMGGVNCMAHRVSYELFVGPIPSGLHILHRCDTPCCVNPDHLYPGTNADNVADKIARGRQPQGATHHSAKLSAEVVALIKRTPRTYGSGRRLAAQLGVREDMIYCIRGGRRRRAS